MPLTDPCTWSGFQCDNTNSVLTSITWASGISVNGTISASLGSLISLKDLEISGQSFLVGFVPNQLSQLTNLLSLQLTQNSITGVLPSSLFSGMTRLQTLVMSSNTALDTQSITSSIASLVSLTELDISGNEFTGSLPSSLFPGLTKLLQLSVGDNRLVGAVPSSICSIASLTSLTLQVTNDASTNKNVFSCVPQW